MALLLAVGFGLSGDILGCGDKFLVARRGSRFQRANAPRQPAVILIYANPASNLPRALANVSVDATLRRAGYTPTSVASEEELASALTRGSWDLIVVDVAEGTSLRSRLPAEPAPVLLPVLFKPTPTELKEAKKQYPRVLASPTKNKAFLDAVDDALAARPAPPSNAAAKTSS